MNMMDRPTCAERRKVLSSLTLLVAAGGLPLHALSAGPTGRLGMPLSTAINRAGRMRALSQRASKAYVQNALGILPEKARDIMANSLRAIEATVGELGAATTQADLRKQLATVEAALGNLRTSADVTPRREAAGDVAKAADVVLESADALTRGYEGLSSAASAKIVNVAGRQRMLSQRAARAFFLIAAGQDGATARRQLDTARSEFGAAMTTLSSAAISTPAIRNELDLARSQWILYEASLVKPPNTEGLQTVATTNERLYEVMDNLTSLYDSAIKDLLG